ncbi:hypothetical protein [Streptomyces sp. NPDC051098]|uniref:hypothetical protein n=1 Tax=Streptomyces sp. NPDC051098 TaxID=3155411 RepID=UPI003429A94F
MESEVVAALIGAPAVLITGAAAWAAGRVQGRNTYRGSVDAVRRAAQRDAYADLYRTAQSFITVARSHRTDTSHRDAKRAALNTLELAVGRVSLEGPDHLADIAARIAAAARALTAPSPFPVPMIAGVPGPGEPWHWHALANAVDELLLEGRRYLNGGPPR